MGIFDHILSSSVKKRMKRAELDTYINKKVEVTFSDEQIKGILKKTGAEEFKGNDSLYLRRGHYLVFFEDGTHTYLFRASHVKKVKQIDED